MQKTIDPPQHRHADADVGGSDVRYVNRTSHEQLWSCALLDGKRPTTHLIAAAGEAKLTSLESDQHKDSRISYPMCMRVIT